MLTYYTRLFVVPKIISPKRLKMALDEALERHKDLTEKQISTALKKTAIKIWGEIIKMTPVDQGRARGNWFIGLAPNAKVGRANKNKGANYVTKAIPKDVLAQKVYLYNNLPYIVTLEYGHSKQAPKGMVRRGLLKWGSTLRKEFKKVVKN